MRVALKPVALGFQIELEFRNVAFLGGGGGNPKYLLVEKKLSGQGKNQQQTEPTHVATSRNQTRDPMMGGKYSLHCTTTMVVAEATIVESQFPKPPNFVSQFSFPLKVRENRILL